MQFDEVHGSRIISVSDATQLGTVDDALLDLEARRVVGFRVKTGGLFSGHKAALLENVKSIGPDAVTVESLASLVEPDANNELRAATALHALKGHQVLDDRGVEAGHLADIDADFNTGSLKNLVLAGTLLERVQHQTRLVPISAVQSFGEKVIVVRTDAGAKPGPAAPEGS